MVPVGVGVYVPIGVSVGVAVSVGVLVGVSVSVGVLVGVGLEVFVGRDVLVGGGVLVGGRVFVGRGVLVWVGVPAARLPAAWAGLGASRLTSKASMPASKNTVRRCRGSRIFICLYFWITQVTTGRLANHTLFVWPAGQCYHQRHPPTP